MTTMLPTPATVPAPPRGPRRTVLVDGITCRGGHLNPPTGRWCAQCGASMVGRRSYVGRGPRPPVGAIVDEAGNITAIGRDIDLGDRPQGSRHGMAMGDQDGAAKLIVSGWEVTLKALSDSGVEVNGRPIAKGSTVRLGPGARIRIGARVSVFESFVGDPSRTA